MKIEIKEIKLTCCLIHGQSLTLTSRDLGNVEDWKRNNMNINYYMIYTFI